MGSSVPPPIVQPSTLSAARRLALSAAIMVVVEMCFGLYSFLTARVLHGSTLSPLAFAWVRDLIASSALLAAAAVLEWRKLPEQRAFWIAREDHMRLMLLGLCVRGEEVMQRGGVSSSPAKLL